MSENRCTLTVNENGVVHLRLTRPDARNAIDLAMVEALADAIDTLDARMHDYSQALGRPDAQNWSDAISSRYAVPTYTTVAATLVRQGFRFPMPTAEDTAPNP